VSVDPRTPEGVAKIARLSRLALTAEEAEALGAHMTKILEWVDELSELDTAGVEAGLRDAARSALRPDVVAPSLAVDAALANAPQPGPLGFEVPAVLSE
jgi:aspartyl-tRNA(Asn)/glutamyl-tRNA(Gln) amidotransferase subunit C